MRREDLRELLDEHITEHGEFSPSELAEAHAALYCDEEPIAIAPTGSSMPPIHPGEILAEEFLEPLGISQYRLALAIGVPPRRINEIVHGKRRISADTALRLARYFGTSERFWMNLQNRYDLEIERDRLANDLRQIKPFATA